MSERRRALLSRASITSGFLAFLGLVDVPGQVAKWWHVLAWLGGEASRWSLTAAFGAAWIVTTVWIRATSSERPAAASRSAAASADSQRESDPSQPLREDDPALVKLRLSVNQANVDRRARIEGALDEQRRLIRRTYTLIGLLEEPDALQLPSNAVTLPRDVRRFAREARGFIKTAELSLPQDELLDDVLEDAMLEGDSRLDLLRVVTSYRDILERRSAASA